MNLVIASNNAHKISEIKIIFADLPLNVLSYSEVFEEKIEAVEDGQTFVENAIKKVEIFPAHKQRIYLAEDSGIEVDWLDGAPGIYSARYAGKNATREEMCYKLLKDCYGAGDRSARYRAAMALKFPDGHIETVEGKVEGSIAHEMLGENGFGYDPVFIPEGYEDTFGQLPESLKHELSHRNDALQKAKVLLMHANQVQNPIQKA